MRGGWRRVAAAVVLAAVSARAEGVYVNEVLANPTQEVGSEWVELFNSEDTAVDLRGWLIGDALREAVIADSTVIVPSGAFVVLAQDAAAFAGYYGDAAGMVIEPASWPILNNGEDVVKLNGPDGSPVDWFRYEEVFPDNVTWSRDPGDWFRWERSRVEGGTPGRVNEVIPEWTGGGLDIAVSPRVFSPDGDGVEDSVVIEVQAPVAGEYLLEIYDREGRRVWERKIGLMTLAPFYIWDGRTQGGGRLPVGIYIVYLEGVGGVARGERARKTVVVAR